MHNLSGETFEELNAFCMDIFIERESTRTSSTKKNTNMLYIMKKEAEGQSTNGNAK